MEHPVRPPNQLLAEIAESTFGTVGVEFVSAVGRLVSTAWGVGGLFVSEADLEDPRRGRVLIAPVPEDRHADWVAAHGESWFPVGSGTKHYAPPRAGSEPVEELLISGHWARTVLSIRLESRGTPHSEYVGIIDAEAWTPEQEESAEAFLRLIAPRVAAELERERLARTAATADRAFRHVVDAAEEAVLVWTGRPPGTVEYVNNAALTLMGRSEPDLRSDASPLLNELVSLPRSEEADEFAYEGDVEVQRPDGVNLMVSARVLVSGPTVARPATHYAVLRPLGDIERAALTPPTADVASQVAEGARVAMMVMHEGAVTYMNKIAAQVFGTTDREHIAARPVVMRAAGRDVRVPFRECVRQLARHRYADRIVGIEGRRGVERIYDVRSSTISVAGSSRLIILLTDVSAREQRTAAIEARYETQRLTLDALPLALLAVAPDGTVRWLNEQWKSREQDPADEFRSHLGLGEGANFVDACRSAIDAGVAGARELAMGLGSVLNGSLPSYMTEYEIAGDEQVPAGRSFVVFVRPLADGAGAIVGLEETSMLTRRERDAKAEAVRSRTLLENLPEQVARLKLNGDVVQVVGPSRRAPTLALLPNGSFKRNVRDVLPTDEAAQLIEAIREASESNSLVVTMLNIMQMERERQYEVHVMPLDGEVLITLLDRTAEQRARRKPSGEGEEMSPRLRRRNPYDLTFREASVLELMSNGASDKEIAAQLGVSVFTVNKHVSKILHKMGAVSRTEASIRAIRESLISR